MIDNLIYGFPSSLNTFLNANGVSIVVSRIGIEIKTCLEYLPNFSVEEIGPLKILDPGESAKNLELISHLPSIRSVLKLILHLMQNSGTDDGLRNLIDSDLTNHLLTIFENPYIFGQVGAFGLAANIMSTFIHNEPTSLSILQEARLPQTFLKCAKCLLPVSAEVISAFPNAFGAICLNQTGLNAFMECDPMDSFFSVFTQEDHVRTLLDNDVPHLIGNSIDEFMRHHPILKEQIMKSLIRYLESILQLDSKVPKSDNCRLFLPDSDLNVKTEELPISTYVDVLSRFLEGLFQNVGHCKDFIKWGGVPLLLDVFLIPNLPYNFSETSSAYSISYLFRVIMENNASEAVGHLHSRFEKTFELLEPLQSLNAESSLLYRYIWLKDPKMNCNAQELFLGLIRFSSLLKILSDLYFSSSLSYSKSINAVAQTFGNESSLLLEKMSKLYM
jgi:E3 ubiquitin-protein ligase HUWE1